MAEYVESVPLSSLSVGRAYLSTTPSSVLISLFASNGKFADIFSLYLYDVKLTSDAGEIATMAFIISHLKLASSSTSQDPMQLP